MSYLMLAAGGAAGALARHRLGTWILTRGKHHFPVGTLLVNLVGALLLGILCGIKVEGNYYLLLGDGFCGAFTTYSTFMVESTQLIRDKAKGKSLLFLTVSVTGGILFFWFGLTVSAAF